MEKNWKQVDLSNATIFDLTDDEEMTDWQRIASRENQPPNVQPIICLIPVLTSLTQ